MKLVRVEQYEVEEAAIEDGKPKLLFHSLRAHHGSGVRVFQKLWRDDFTLRPGKGGGTTEGMDAAFKLHRFLFFKLARPYGGWDDPEDVREPVVAFSFDALLKTGRLYMQPIDVGMEGACTRSHSPRALAAVFEAYTQRDPRAVQQLAEAHIEAACRLDKYDTSYLLGLHSLFPRHNIKDAQARSYILADWETAMGGGPMWQRSSEPGAHIEMIYEGPVPIRGALYFRAPGFRWYRVV